MTEWLCHPRREPTLVEVTWTDAAYDPTIACSLGDIAKKATLSHNRKSDGRLVYISSEGRDARVVLCNLYDAPESKDDEATFENFMIIPLGWVERIKIIRGPVIYTREPAIPPSRRTNSRPRAVRE